MGIGYLKSYDHMGRVLVECAHDCTCDGLVIDAHTSEHISPLDLQYFTARRRHEELPPATHPEPAPRRCGVRLTVLNSTSSGEHKFKLTALFLNQLGGKDMFGGWTAKNALFSKEEAAKREAKEAAKPV